MDYRHSHPWIVVNLGQPHHVLSWSLTHPGLVTAHRIVWREARNADLPRERDARSWLLGEMETSGYADAVCLLTSRDIRRHHVVTAEEEGETAWCFLTCGLSNRERIGQRQLQHSAVGTINILVRTGSALTQAAMLEAISIITQARTLAVLEAALPTGPDGAAATGTGTDCIALASPVAGEKAAYAGLHTALGEAIGAAVLGAMRSAVTEWKAEQR